MWSNLPTYRITIERGVRFELDMEAASRFDALQMVSNHALIYDVKDSKDTRVVAIKELKQEHVLNSPD
jgi:hypothetical protein